MFFIVANPMVKRFPLPESFAGFPDDLVCFASGITFPTLHDRTHSLIRRRPEDDVHMVRHDDPSIQSVTVAIEKTERPSDQIRNLGPFQPTFSAAGIEEMFEIAKIVALNFFNRVLGCGRFARLISRGRLAVEAMQSLRAIGLILKQDIFRQRIRESKSYEIARAFAFDVREKTASVNTRSQRVCRLWFDAVCAKFEFHAVNSGIAFLRTHGGRLAKEHVDRNVLCAGNVHVLPSATRRYGRLQICATSVALHKSDKLFTAVLHMAREIGAECSRGMKQI